jgi:uncharacterized Zn-finger protein
MQKYTRTNLSTGAFTRTNNHLESIRTTVGEVDSEQSEETCLPQY